MAVARIRKDIGSLYKSTPADIVLTEDTGANLESIRLQIKGPDGTPYHGGLWDLLIKVPSDYPTSPPKVYFQTKIFHPNVHPLTGEVCVDTLKRDWTSDLNLCHILLTIRCLLILPNPDSSLNEEAGKLLHEDYAAFERAARLVTNVHARDDSHVLQPTDGNAFVSPPPASATDPASKPMATSTTAKKKKSSLKRL